MDEASYLRICNSKSGQEYLALDLMVSPRASRTKIQSIYNNRIKIQIAAPPTDGSANETLIKFISKIFKVPKSAISIVNGEVARRKTIKIEGIGFNKALEIINNHLNP